MADVRVWWSAADAPAAVEALFTPAEHDRLGRLARPVDQDRFRSGRALLRALVADAAAVGVGDVGVSQTCDRCGGSHGRPVATVRGRLGPPVSLSHAGGLVVAALAAAPVGVDLEPLGAVPPGVAEVALSAVEQAQLTEVPEVDRPDTLTRWWVRKEAVLKAVGFGLHLDPSHIEVSPPHEPPAVVGWQGAGRPRALQMADLRIDDAYAATVAVATRRAPRVVLTHVPLSGRLW